MRLVRALAPAAGIGAGHLGHRVFGAGLVCLPALVAAVEVGREEYDSIQPAALDEKMVQACLASLGYVSVDFAEVLDQGLVISSAHEYACWSVREPPQDPLLVYPSLFLICFAHAQYDKTWGSANCIAWN